MSPLVLIVFHYYSSCSIITIIILVIFKQWWKEGLFKARYVHNCYKCQSCHYYLEDYLRPFIFLWRVRSAVVVRKISSCWCVRILDFSWWCEVSISDSFIPIHILFCISRHKPIIKPFDKRKAERRIVVATYSREDQTRHHTVGINNRKRFQNTVTLLYILSKERRSE